MAIINYSELEEAIVAIEKVLEKLDLEEKELVLKQVNARFGKILELKKINANFEQLQHLDLQSIAKQFRQGGDE